MGEKDDHARTNMIEIHTVNVPLCQVYLSLYRLDNYAISTLEIIKTVDFLIRGYCPIAITVVIGGIPWGWL